MREDDRRRRWEKEIGEGDTRRSLGKEMEKEVLEQMGKKIWKEDLEKFRKNMQEGAVGGEGPRGLQQPGEEGMGSLKREFHEHSHLRLGQCQCSSQAVRQSR